jgi:UDP-N-acetylmuramate--alanine ligase
MNLFPGKHCTVIFQPHLFTRTRDLADGFAEALDIAHQVILLPIYPAREMPIPGVTSETITAKMKNNDVTILDKKMVLDYMGQQVSRKETHDHLFITAGAGDIDTLVEPIKQILSSAK